MMALVLIFPTVGFGGIVALCQLRNRNIPNWYDEFEGNKQTGVLHDLGTATVRVAAVARQTGFQVSPRFLWFSIGYSAQFEW
jgi:hypothetical protein